MKAATKATMPDPFSFRLIATDGAARAGGIRTAHGVVRTPAFMPVGTQAAIKGVHHDDVRAAGADIMLANTYHLMLRPSASRSIFSFGGPCDPHLDPPPFRGRKQNLSLAFQT